MVALPFLLVLLSVALAKVEIKEEESVSVLTKDNFDDAVQEYPFTMVMFYASWCGHCQAFKPEYKKAAEELKASMPSVLVAKVDAIAEADLASQHGVKGFPTLKFHKGGKWIDYNGDRNADALVNWIKKKSGPSVALLNTTEEVEAFIKTANAVVGFISDGQTEAERVFEEVADSMDKFSFGIARSSDIFKRFDVHKEVQITLFKEFDEGRVDFADEPTFTKITEFVQLESIPLIVEFSQDSAGAVFGSPVRMHLVAFAPKSGDYDKIVEQMRPTAKSFKGKVHFIIIDTDIEDHQRILDFFGMSKDDLPAYRLINLSEDMIKYKPDSSDFSQTPMSAFIQEVLEGARKPFLMSQEIPPESNEPVRVLVGKNYNEVTKDESKAVFVKLYAPWCGHCQQLAPIWASLAEAFKDREDIIIAKFDATVNEAEGLRVHSFPILKYYPKGSQEIIDYTGERTLEALKKFVESEGKSVAAEEQGKEDKESKDEL